MQRFLRQFVNVFLGVREGSSRSAKRSTGLLILVFVLIALGSSVSLQRYRSRVSVWDTVHDARGRIAITTGGAVERWLSKRAAFGLGWCDVLELRANGLSEGADILNAIPNARRLHTLILTNSHLNDDDIARVAGSELKVLSLDGNNITDSITSVIERCPSLEMVDLARTRVSNHVVSKLATLERLVEVNLQETKINQAAFDSLKWQGALMRVNLSGTDLNGVTALSLPDTITELVATDLHDPRPVLATLPNMPRLELLNLDRCNLNEADGAWLEKLVALVHLSAVRSGMDGSMLNRARDLEKLGYLNLSGCPISEKGWMAIRQLKSVRYLVCRDLDIQTWSPDDMHLPKNVYSIDLTGSILGQGHAEELRRSPGLEKIYLE